MMRLLLVVLLAGCLRPAQERAELDLTVGQASTSTVTLEVSNGLSVVRSLTDTQAELWAQAPDFELTVEFESPPAQFALTVHNVMPNALPNVPHVLELGDVPTVRTFRFLSPPATLRARIAPPDAQSLSAFQFAALSDVQEAINRVEDVWQRINEQPNVRFVIGAGDLTQRGTQDQLELFQQKLRVLRVPYYPTLGNHELGGDVDLWPRFFGRASLHFEFHNVAFTLLDSASATIDPLVYQQLDGWLEQAQDQQHVVAMHIPPVDPIGVRNGSFASRDEASKLLGKLGEGNVDLTIYGHIHSYYSFFNGGITAVISGGGGAIPERFDGVGRHFILVDADPNQGLATQVVRVNH